MSHPFFFLARVEEKLLALTKQSPTLFHLMDWKLCSLRLSKNVPKNSVDRKSASPLQLPSSPCVIECSAQLHYIVRQESRRHIVPFPPDLPNKCARSSNHKSMKSLFCHASLFSSLFPSVVVSPMNFSISLTVLVKCWTPGRENRFAALFSFPSPHSCPWDYFSKAGVLLKLTFWGMLRPGTGQTWSARPGSKCNSDE